jgi:hypothetical protein
LTADQIPSPKTKTWKGRVAKQLRRIQQGSGSPSSPTAPNPEGVTIGIPLENCPQVWEIKLAYIFYIVELPVMYVFNNFEINIKVTRCFSVLSKHCVNSY